MSLMRTMAMWPAVLLALLGSSSAQAQIYKCVAASGAVEYTDVRRGPQCKALELPGALIPAPASMPARRASAVPARSAPAGAPAGMPAAVPATAGEFPRVDSSEQRARDADRRAILEDELRSETAKLAELRKAFNLGAPERLGDERNDAKYQQRVAAMRDGVSRSEKNVEALKREIATIR